ncbi:MAG: TlyA family RNA methyltransferase [Deltaproteobacteria bacterium]|nr:TlyA family RNA methyltransferase [Deltaproteobacteria bacterium]
MNGNKKIRLDDLLLLHGIAKDKKEAQSLIMSGKIQVNEETVRVPHSRFDNSVRLNIREEKYVSRGGIKLEGALSDFGIDVRGFVCADIGISTGGFTDCLLKKGAAKVYGFDVGYGVLNYSLRNDSRVILFERCNFRKFDVSVISEKVDLIVMDVSFISVKKIIPNAVEILKHRGLMLILIKPQFEVPRNKVKKGGIVDDMRIVENVLFDIKEFLTSLGFEILGIKPARIKGERGNQEYFIFARMNNL